MAPDTRQRMLDSAVELFRQHGYNGTGFREVVAHSGAPRGSIYHHFPGGKAQLGAEALGRAGEFIDDKIKAAGAKGEFVAAFEAFWAWWIDYVESSGFRAGCPVAGVAAETHPEAAELSQAAAAAFERWQATLRRALRYSGMSADDAADFATLILSALEGATLLARAEGGPEPLERVGRRLALILRAALQA